MGMDDRIGPAGGARRKENTAPGPRFDRWNDGRVAQTFAQRLDGEHLATKGSEERRFGSDGNDSFHIGEAHAITPLVLCERGIERHLRCTRQLDTVTRPDGGDTIAQKRRQRLAWLDAVGEEARREPRRPSRKLTIGEITDAIADTDQITELIRLGLERA